MTAHIQVPLGEICTINPRVTRGEHSDDTPVSFVPMAAVDECLGAIRRCVTRPYAEVSKGYTAFENGDVLFAKITPCMENGKAALARNLTNGVGRGSTEFYILRPGHRVLGEYIYHFVRQTRFREEAKRNFTGTAGQQRVPKSYMESVSVTLPPLGEQRRIVQILNRAAKIERLRAQAAERLREFVPALFIKMFGDPAQNPMRWPQRRIGDVCDVQGGLQVTKKRNTNPIEAPYLRVANVLRDRLVLEDIKLIRLTENELVRARLVPGDLLIVEGHGNVNEIGRVAEWSGQIRACVHQNHLIRARPNRSLVSPSFVAAYLNSSSGRQQLLRRGKTTSGLNTITTSDVRNCTTVVPPIGLQQRFSGIIFRTREMQNTTATGTRASLDLFGSLMERLLGR